MEFILKASFYIGKKAAQTNYYASLQAERIGYPLNFHVTINYSLTNIDPRKAVSSFSTMRRSRFNKWATRPCKGSGPAFSPTFVFAFENNRNGVPFMTLEDGDDHNVHVHWTLHVPPARLHDFKNRLWGWVTETTGGVNDSRAIEVRSQNASSTSYLLKGATQSVVKKYGRGHKAEPQGIIYGRRADTSRNIGPTARRYEDSKRKIDRRFSYVANSS